MLLLLKGEVQLCLATGHFLTLAAGVISTFSEVVQLAKQGTNFLFFFFSPFLSFPLRMGEDCTLMVQIGLKFYGSTL